MERIYTAVGMSPEVLAALHGQRLEGMDLRGRAVCYESFSH